MHSSNCLCIHQELGPNRKVDVKDKADKVNEADKVNVKNKAVTETKTLRIILERITPDFIERVSNASLCTEHSGPSRSSSQNDNNSENTAETNNSNQVCIVKFKFLLNGFTCLIFPTEPAN